MEEEGKDGVEQ